MFKKTILFATLTAFGASAYEPITPSEALVAKVSQYVAANAEKVEYFQAQDELIGIAVVSKDFQKHVFYTNKSGEFIVSGVMIDTETSTNLTQAFSESLTFELPESLTDAIQETSYVVQGNPNASKKVYAVVDANCGYCHRLWNNIQQGFAQGLMGDVAVHWIPVGFMGSDSVVKAQAILSAEDQQTAFDSLDKAMRKQQLTVTPEQRAASAEQLSENEAFMFSNNFRGVPFVMAQVEGDWSLVKGLPSPNFLASLRAPSSSEDHKESAE